MKKRVVSIFLTLVLMLQLLSLQAEAGNRLEDPGVIRPGQIYTLHLHASKADSFDVLLLNPESDSLLTVFKNKEVEAGENTLLWNTNDSGIVLKKGSYSLLFKSKTQEFSKEIEIGEAAPNIERISLQSASLEPGREWKAQVTVNMAGKLHVGIKIGKENKTVSTKNLQKGENDFLWDGKIDGEYIKSGSYMLHFQFEDENGFKASAHYVALKIAALQIKSDEEEISLLKEGNEPEEKKKEEVLVIKTDEKAVETAQEAEEGNLQQVKYLPPTREQISQDRLGSNFWTLPVGKLDEEAIWKVMMQPITVIQGKDQRLMYKVRKTPDKSTKRDNVVGEVTFLSQGVHILETLDNGWTLIEAYNSSYGPTFKRKGFGSTDEIIKGYVETNLLKEIKPKEDFGILIDKLKQVMYVFEKGKIKGELIISTGLPSEKSPWQETPSGEYLMVSKVGDFNSGNLVCGMGMRINGGTLIHEVPYIYYADRNLKDYSAQVNQLGFKASHGCVRVQRSKNSQGMNMAWLWKNIKLNTKVLVWDDDSGRYQEYPDDALELYYNPRGGKFYHQNPNCLSVAARLLPLKGKFTYGELENAEYAKYEPCRYCKPPLDRRHIEEANKKNGF